MPGLAVSEVGLVVNEELYMAGAEEGDGWQCTLG